MKKKTKAIANTRESILYRKKHARTQKLKMLARDQIYEAFLAHCSGILKECRGDLSRRDSFFYA